MRRIVLAILVAATLGTGFAFTAHAQNPTTNCQICRAQYNSCMEAVRTPSQAAACRAALKTCIASCL